MKHFRDNDTGQAITEFAVTIPLFLVLLVGVFYLGECVVWWQRTSMAARYSAWRYAKNPDGNDHLANLDKHKRYFFGNRDASYRFDTGERFESEGLPSWMSAAGEKLLGIRSCRVDFKYTPPPGMRMFRGEVPMAAIHKVCRDTWPRKETGALPHFIKELIAD